MAMARSDAVPAAEAFPSEIRHRVLEDHARLRQLLARVEALAHRVLGGDLRCAGDLRTAGRQLTSKLVRHLDLEEEILVPAIRAIDSWGPERARRVLVEHAEQRQQIRDLDRELAVDADADSLASELRTFAAILHADMLAEEAAVLDPDLLRDDVVGIDVETG